MEAAEDRRESYWVEGLATASLNYGQLAIILIENRSVTYTMISVLRKPATFATMKPLLECHYLKKCNSCLSAESHESSQCVVERHRPSAGANPARQLSFQPVAIGASYGGNDVA